MQVRGRGGGGAGAGRAGESGLFNSNFSLWEFRKLFLTQDVKEDCLLGAGGVELQWKPKNLLRPRDGRTREDASSGAI
jgi:hypothetical protein